MLAPDRHDRKPSVELRRSGASRSYICPGCRGPGSASTSAIRCTPRT